MGTFYLLVISACNLGMFLCFTNTHLEMSPESKAPNAIHMQVQNLYHRLSRLILNSLSDQLSHMFTYLMVPLKSFSFQF